MTANSLYQVDDTFSKIFFLWLIILTVQESDFFLIILNSYYPHLKQRYMSSDELRRHF